MASRRQGLLGGAVGVLAAGAGAVLVADHRVGQQRTRGAAAQAPLTAKAHERAGFLPLADGVTLYYEQTGPDDAPVTVVFVHGFCLSRDTFVFQQRSLREHFGDRVRLVAYDHRSHGRSTRSPAENATIEQLGEDLHTVLSKVVPRGPVVLVGHSMGGMTVMALADAHPDLFGPAGRVRGVVLVGTSTGKLAAVTLGMPAAFSKLRKPFMPVLLGGARHGPKVVERGRARLTDVAWVFVKRLAFGPDVDPALVEFVTTMIGETSVDVMADFFPALMNHDKLEALAHLLHTPVVVVSGTDDVVTPPQHSRDIAAALPEARLVRVPRTGHMVLMERPDQIDVPLAELVESALAEAGSP